MNFFAAMIKYPEIQKKGQAEIDRVIGPNRLPDFTDEASLPYVAAIVKEALRWHLIANSSAFWSFSLTDLTESPLQLHTKPPKTTNTTVISSRRAPSS